MKLTREIVLALRAEGKTYGEIGEMHGLSRQRIKQIEEEYQPCQRRENKKRRICAFCGAQPFVWMHFIRKGIEVIGKIYICETCHKQVHRANVKTKAPRETGTFPCHQCGKEVVYTKAYVKRTVLCTVCQAYNNSHIQFPNRRHRGQRYSRPLVCITCGVLHGKAHQVRGRCMQCFARDRQILTMKKKDVRMEKHLREYYTGKMDMLISRGKGIPFFYPKQRPCSAFAT